MGCGVARLSSAAKLEGGPIARETSALPGRHHRHCLTAGSARAGDLIEEIEPPTRSREPYAALVPWSLFFPLPCLRATSDSGRAAVVNVSSATVFAAMLAPQCRRWRTIDDACLKRGTEKATNLFLLFFLVPWCFFACRGLRFVSVSLAFLSPAVHKIVYKCMIGLIFFVGRAQGSFWSKMQIVPSAPLLLFSTKNYSKLQLSGGDRPNVSG